MSPLVAKGLLLCYLLLNSEWKVAICELRTLLPLPIVLSSQVSIHLSSTNLSKFFILHAHTSLSTAIHVYITSLFGKSFIGGK